MKKLAGILLTLTLVGCGSTQPNNTSSLSATAQGDCDSLRAEASWESTTLYDLTYQCPPEGWEAYFADAAVKAELKAISDEINQEVKQGKAISPTIGNTFRALYMVKPTDMRAVIMGQDPAPQPGLATGLSFSLSPTVSTSEVASVQRVFLEAQNEGNCVDLDNGSLEGWAEQGVLLLNMALTIPCPVDGQGRVGFCKIAGHVPLWQDFSHSLVSWIDTHDTPISYILWGSKAGQYASLVTNEKHQVLKGGHPSPKARGDRFFCKGYFKNANQWLSEHQKEPIDWNLAESCTQQHQACVWAWHRSRNGQSARSTCTTPCS